MSSIKATDRNKSFLIMDLMVSFRTGIWKVLRKPELVGLVGDFGCLEFDGVLYSS